MCVDFSPKRGKTSKQCNNTSGGNIVTVRLLSDTQQGSRRRGPKIIMQVFNALFGFVTFIA